MAVITIWGDESSQNGHKYMVLGTIWQNPICAVDLERDIQQLRRLTGFQKEFHWAEMKKHQLPAYKGLIEIFKEYMDQGLLKFRALVVDQSDKKHMQYSSDHELHFYKMYFWLIYKRLRFEHSYDIFLDRKSNSVPGRLQDLKNTLNNKLSADHRTMFGFPINNVVRRVEARDGSQIELQLADVFAGAIAYVVNGHASRSENPNAPKLQLMNHIQQVIGIDLTSCHLYSQSPSFNIWCFSRN